MWELDYKENWALKNWCSWTVVLENTFQSLLDSKNIQPVHYKGNQPWIFTRRTDTEAETPILWPPGAKNWLIGKDPDAGKDWRLEEKGMTEDEILYGISDPMDSRSWWWTGWPGVLQAKSWTQLSDWTELIFFAAEDEDRLDSQQKQDLELTVPQIMSSLLQNSSLNWRK